MLLIKFPVLHRVDQQGHGQTLLCHCPALLAVLSLQDSMPGSMELSMGTTMGSGSLLQVINSCRLFPNIIGSAGTDALNLAPTFADILCNEISPSSLLDSSKWMLTEVIRRENNLQEVIQSVRSQLSKGGPPNNFSKNKTLCVRIIFFWQFSLYTQEGFPISQASCLTGKTGHTNRFLSFFFSPILIFVKHCVYVIHSGCFACFFLRCFFGVVLLFFSTM